MNTHNNAAALTPIRICDFSGQLAGAGATRYLAAMGAQVIRIEDRLSRGGWDMFRGTGPYKDDRRGHNLGGMYNNHNIEKLGITLNAKSLEGQEILRELVSISDVVTENFSAGVMERWGFGYEEMQKVKPDIIYVSNSGFGHSGPYKSFKSWGPVVQAVSGLTYQSGLPNMPPAGLGYSYMDHTGGYLMAIAILMALYHRYKTGEGQYVDMSCTDAALALNGPALLDYTVNGRPSSSVGQPNSNRSHYPPMAPHGIYKSSGNDKWIAIAVRTEEEWKLLSNLFAMQGIKDLDKYATLDKRLEQEDELDNLVTSWTEKRTSYESMNTLQRLGIPAASVQNPEERIDKDPNILAWNAFPEVQHAEMGPTRVEGLAMKFTKTPATIGKGGNLLGEDNKYVYEEILNIDPNILTNLQSIGVI